MIEIIDMIETPVSEMPALISDSCSPTTVVIKLKTADPIDLVKLVSPPKIEYSKKISFRDRVLTKCYSVVNY